MSRTPFCSKCKGLNDRTPQRYCRACKAAYDRKWRAHNPLSEEARRKDIVRSIAGVYKRRGALIPEPCAVCGTDDVEMHHPDYARPLHVEWLCRTHHLEHHKQIDGVKHETLPERARA